MTRARGTVLRLLLLAAAVAAAVSAHAEPTEVAFGAAADASSSSSAASSSASGPPPAPPAPKELHWDEVAFEDLTPKERRMALAAKAENRRTEARAQWLEREIARLGRVIAAKDETEVKVYKQREDRSLGRLREEVAGLRKELLGIHAERERRLAEETAKAQASKRKEQGLKRKEEQDGKAEQVRKERMRKEEAHQKDLAARRDESKAKLQAELDRYTKDRDLSVKKQMKYERLAETAAKRAARMIQAKQKADEANAKKVAATKKTVDAEVAAEKAKAHRLEQAQKQRVALLKAEEQRRKTARAAEKAQKKKMEQGHKEERQKQEAERKAAIKASELEQKGSEADRKLAAKLLAKEDQDAAKRLHERELAEAGKRIAEQQTKQREIDARNANRAAQIRADQLKAQLAAAEETKKAAAHAEATARAQKNRDAARQAQEETEKAERAAQKAERARQVAEQDAKVAEQKEKTKREESVKARAAEEEATKERIAAAKLKEQTEKARVKAEQADKKAEAERQEAAAKERQANVHAYERAARKVKAAVQTRDDSVRQAAADRKVADDAQKEADALGDRDPPRRAQLQANAVAKTRVWATSSARAKALASAVVPVADAAATKARATKQDSLAVEATAAYNEAQKTEIDADGVRQDAKEELELRTRLGAETQAMAKAHLVAQEEAEKAAQKAEEDKKAAIKAAIKAAAKARVDAHAVVVEAEAGAKAAQDAAEAAQAEADRAAKAKTVAAFKRAVEKAVDSLDEARVAKTRAESAVAAAQVFVRLATPTEQDATKKLAADELKDVQASVAAADLAVERATAHVAAQRTALAAAEAKVAALKAAAAKRVDEARARELVPSSPHQAWGRSHRLPQYALNEGACHLSGVVRGLRMERNAGLLTLPSACRPSHRLSFSVAVGEDGEPAQVDVFPDGRVAWVAGAITEDGPVVLDGVFFTTSGASMAALPINSEGWTNFGDQFRGASYRVERDVCYLSGLIRTVSGKADPWARTLVERLPEGCRPLEGASTEYFTVASGEHAHVLAVSADGRLSWAGGERSRFWLSLDGVAFAVGGFPDAPAVREASAPRGNWSRPEGADERATGTYRSGELCVVTGAAVSRVAPADEVVMRLPAGCHPENGVVSASAVDVTGARHSLRVLEDGTVRWSGPEGAPKKGVAVGFGGLRFVAAPEQSWEKDGAVRVANEQEAERLAKAEAERQARAAARAAAVPKPITVAHDFETYGAVYRPPQYARVGPFCLASGLARRLGSFKGVALSGLPDACLDKAPVVVGTLTGTAEAVTMLVDPKARTLKWAAGAAAGNYLPLDGVQFAVNAAEDNGTRLGTETSLSAAEGFSGAARVVQWESVCGLAGMIAASAKITTEQSESGALLTRLPATCRPDATLVFAAPTAGGSSLTVEVRETGDVVLRKATVGTLPGVSLARVMFTIGGQRKALEPADGYRNQGAPYRAASFRRQGWLCVVSGTVSTDAGAHHVTTLPDECRPASGRLIFTTAAGNRAQRVDVLPDGRVILVAGPTSKARGLVSLDGVQFTVAEAQEWEDDAVRAADQARAARAAEAAAKARAEENAKAAAAAAKLKQDSTPVPVDVVAPRFVPLGMGRRFPQVAMTPSLCVLSGAALSTENRTSPAGVAVLKNVPAACRPDAPLRVPAFGVAGASPNDTSRAAVRGEMVVAADGTAKMGAAAGPASFYSVSPVVVPRKGASTPKALPLEGSYKRHGADSLSVAPTYVRDAEFGLCALYGVVGPLSASARHMATLPAECRPDRTVYFNAAQGLRTVRVSVDDQGRVSFAGMLKGDTDEEHYVSLSGLAFSPQTLKADKLTLGSGWAKYGPAVPAVRKHKNLCVASGQVEGREAFVAAVPATCRPASGGLVFFVNAFDRVERVEVTASGNLVWRGRPADATAKARLSLDGLVWLVAPEQKWETNARAAVALQRAQEREVRERAARAHAAKWARLSAPEPIELENGYEPRGPAVRVPQHARFGSLCVLSGIAATQKMATIGAQLPPRCTPLHREAFGLDTQRSTTTRFDITEQGAIPFVTGGDGRWVSYDGMLFVANDTSNEQGENKPTVLALDKAWKPLGGGFQAPTVAVERGLCLLSGVANSTVGADGRFDHTVVGTVPDACRPRDGSLVMHANRHNVSVRIDVSGDGKLTIKADAPAPGVSAVSLSGLAWFPKSEGSPKMAAGFGALGDGFRPPSFRREGAFCALSGVVQGAKPESAGQVAPLLTLPEECRPASGTLLFTVNHHTHTEAVIVRPDGSVMWRRASAERTWLSLDGVHFLVNKPQAWEVEAKAALIKRNAERAAARRAAFLKLAQPTRLEPVEGDATANFSLSSEAAAEHRWPQFARYNSLCLLSGAGELVGRAASADQVLAALPKECRPAQAHSFPAVDYRFGGAASPRTLVLGSKEAKEHGVVRTEGGFANHTLYSFDGVVFAGQAAAADATSVVSKPIALADGAWQASAPSEDHESNWDEPQATFDSGMCVLSGVVAPAAVSQSQRKHTFKHTGADQTLAVPKGTKGLFVKLWGAAGGGGKFLESRWTSGAGAYTEVVVPEELAEAGGTLTVRVGGGGTVSEAGKEAAKGAFPSGGRGFGGTGTAGGGGGRTEVLFNGVLLAVAAGGGGSTGYGGHAGAGGGLRGQDGYLTGRGATQTAGGLNHDKSGAKFAGGRGGTSAEDDGAGGGDGYYGGAGGGGDAHSGGGGAGYINREKGVRGVMLSGHRAQPPATDDADYPGGDVARGVPSEGRAGNPGFAVVVLDAERGPDEWSSEATIGRLPWPCRPRGGASVTLAVGGGRRVRVSADGRVHAQLLESRTLSLGGAAFFVQPGTALKLETGKPFGAPYRAPGAVSAFQLCSLTGVLKEAQGELLARLPAGCRPSGELEFVAYASDSNGELLRVLPNGELLWPAWTPERALSLDGVHLMTTGGEPANWEVQMAKARADAKAAAAEERLGELHALAAPARVELLNNDTYYGHGSRVPQVSRHGAVCVVSGMLKGEDLSKAVARLPASCRPENQVAFDVHLDETSTARFDVKKDGTVQRVSGASAGEWVSLDGLSFVHKGAEGVRREELPLAANFEGAGGEFGAVPSVSFEDGVCVLEGLVKARNTSLWHAGSLVATLPRHCWPVGGNLVFKANAGAASHRLDIFADGRVVWVAGLKAGDLLSLSGILFAPQAPQTPVEFGAGWEAYGMEYREPAVTVTGALCVVTGMVRADGGDDTGKHVATLPSGCRPTGVLTFAVSHGAAVERVVVRENGHVEWEPVLKSDDASLKHSWLTLDGVAFVAVPEPEFETKVKDAWQTQYEKEQKAAAEKAEAEAAEQAKRDAAAKAEAEKAKAAAAAKAKAEAEAAKAAEAAEAERQKAAAEDKAKSGHRLELADGVEPMGRGYAVPQVIKVSKNVCLLQGAAYAGNMRRVVAKLPKECHPAGRVVLLGQTTAGHNTRHDVMPNGDLQFVSSTSRSEGGLVSFGGLTVIGADADIRDVQLSESQFTNAGDPYVDATYRRVGNLCVLQGVVKITSPGGKIGTLDRECHPGDGQLIFQVSNGMGNHWRVDVTREGNVHFVSYGNGANGGFHKQVSLSGISFFRGSQGSALPLATGWSAYGYGYRVPSIKREGKVCALSGLARGNQFGLLAVVPPECRPSRRMIFSVNMHQYSQRVDVMEDGRVMWKDGNLAHGWLSLDGLMWSPNTYKLKIKEADSKPLQVGKPQVLQGWSSEGGDYRGLQYARFGQLCMLSGVLLSKTGGLNTPMLRLPEECRPGDATHVFNAHTDGAAVVRYDISPSGKVAWKGGSPKGTFMPVTSAIFAVEGARREELHLDSRYVHYGGGYAKAAMTLDGDLCVLQGLVREPHYGTMPGGLITVLPPDCRPKDGRLIFTSNHNDIVHRMDVLKNGHVYYVTGTRRYSWTSFDGIAFATTSATQPVTGLNGWNNYGYGYRRPSYRMVGEGNKVCVVSGLMRGGHGRTITRLPKQCRPDRRLVFYVNHHQYGIRVDVFPDGRVMYISGHYTHGWVSLDGIRFVADKAPVAALSAYKVVAADKPTVITTFGEGVKAVGDEWAVPSFARNGPLCQLSGMVHTGDSMRKVLLRLPATCRPSGHLAFGLGSNNAETERVDVFADGQVRWVAGPARGHWLSLDGIVFTVAGTRHNPLELMWQYVPLGRGYREPQITRVGSLCVVSGMVRTENYHTNTWAREVARVDSSCVPNGRLIFRTNLDVWTHRVDVLRDGRLYITSGPALQRPYLSLDGISFSMEDGHPLTLLPGWDNYYGEFRHASYVKEGNLCVLSGLINGNGAVHITTLPRECRPAKRLVYWVDADQHNTRLDVLPDGRLVFKGPRYRSWVPLDGVSFQVAEFLAVASPDERASISKEGTQIALLDGFRNSNDGYRNAVWTRVGKFCVLSGRVTANDIRGRIGQLPKECRPEKTLMFDTHNGVYSAEPFTVRVDVQPDGIVKWASSYSWDQASGNYISLDGISFAVHDAKGRLALSHKSYLNGYTPTHDKRYSGVEVTVDGDVCHVQGLAVQPQRDTAVHGHVVQLPSSCRPKDGSVIFNGNLGATTGRLTVHMSGHVQLETGSFKHNFVSLSNIFFFLTPGTRLQMRSGWGAQGGGSQHWRKPQWKRVTLGGKQLCMLGGLALGSRTGTMGVLPEECRPMERLQFELNNHQYVRRVDVFPDGRIVNMHGNSHGWLALSSISFVVPKNREESAYPLVDDGKMTTKAVKLVNGFEDYKRGYRTPSFSKWGKLCMLQGVARTPGKRLDHVAAQVPAECQPSARLAFNRMTKGDATFRLDVTADGAVRYAAGNADSDALSLDGLVWPAKDAPQGTVELSSKWVPQGRGYMAPGWVRQGDLCVVSGMARTSNGHYGSFSNEIALLPGDCRPKDGRLVFYANTQDDTFRMDVETSGRVSVHAHGRRGIRFPTISLSDVRFFVKSERLDLWSGWSAYNHGYRAPGYTVQGDVCALSGLANGNGRRELGRLPPACRPRARTWFNVNHHQYVHRMDVMTDGRIVWVSGPRHHSWVSLDGILFERQPFKDD